MPLSASPARPCCDIFCNVIDNFGDAGVCWRLARALGACTDWQIRLFIDAPDLIDRLDGTTPSGHRPVRVVHWNDADGSEVADIVIEAFACRIPETYLAALRRRTPAPVWVNLDYLSAEAWIDGCHGLASPDPVSGIAKYFYFPGFTPGSGGLIREAGLDALIHELRQDETRDRWLVQKLGVHHQHKEGLVSLFCYPDSPFDDLLAAWQASGRPVHCLLAAGLPESDLQKMAANATSRGLRVTRLPFLPQEDYDRLLAASDVNFVRGEDSFVRAQWVGRPFVWQAYRQADEVHHVKLDAFLARYLAGMPGAAADAVGALHAVWNGRRPWQDDAWRDFAGQSAAIAAHNDRWQAVLRRNGNLAENLANFCQSKL